MTSQEKGRESGNDSAVVDGIIIFNGNKQAETKVGTFGLKNVLANDLDPSIIHFVVQHQEQDAS